MKGNQTFETLEKAADFVTDFSSVIDSDVNINMPVICKAERKYSVRPKAWNVQENNMYQGKNG